MRSDRKNPTSSTGYGEMGPPDGTPRHKVESIASGTRSLCCHTLGTRATQVRAPGPGENGPSPFPQNISPIASGALPKPTGRSPCSSAGDPRAICTRTPCPRATVNRPNGSSSIVPTQQVDAHIRLAGIEGRRTPRAGGRRGCRSKNGRGCSPAFKPEIRIARVTG